MSSTVFDNELADKNLVGDLGLSIGGKIQDYSFRLPEKYKLTMQAFWCTKNSHGVV